MPLLTLTLMVGAAVGGLLAALPALKHSRRSAEKGSRSDAAPAAQHRAAASEEDWSAQDEHLIRELRDDMELRLRSVRRMAPGEQRRAAVRSLRRQFSGYANNQRLAPLLTRLGAELERRTEALLGDAVPAMSSSCSSSSAGWGSSSARVLPCTS